MHDSGTLQFIVDRQDRQDGKAGFFFFFALRRDSGRSGVEPNHVDRSRHSARDAMARDRSAMVDNQSHAAVF